MRVYCLAQVGEESVSTDDASGVSLEEIKPSVSEMPESSSVFAEEEDEKDEISPPAVVATNRRHSSSSDTAPADTMSSTRLARNHLRNTVLATIAFGKPSVPLVSKKLNLTGQTGAWR